MCLCLCRADNYQLASMVVAPSLPRSLLSSAAALMVEACSQTSKAEIFFFFFLVEIPQESPVTGLSVGSHDTGRLEMLLSCHPGGDSVPHYICKTDCKQLKDGTEEMKRYTPG